MVLFPPPFYFVFDISNLLSYIQNNFSYELARPIMGTIFLVYYIMYIRTYVRTFLIRVRVLVICDRNSIARKREEFPILVAEVASSRLHFSSRARLLQLLQQTILHYASSQCGTQYNYRIRCNYSATNN